MKAGQHLTFTSLSIFLAEILQPLGPSSALLLSGLAPSALVSVPVGATLELHNVTLVLSRTDLTSLFTGLCRDTGAWPHSPGVTMDDGTIAIQELDTTAPGPDGTPKGGGMVRWRVVLITCTDQTAVNRTSRPGLWKPYPCAARPVDAGSDGGTEELRRASSVLLDSTNGPVFLSLTANISLTTGFGYWNVLLLNCTLLSASAYAALPGAVPLLPQSRVWPPLLLHRNWMWALEQGPTGLAVAPGLEAALASQERVCKALGGATVTFVARRHDDTVSPADQDPEGGIIVGGKEAAGPGAGKGSSSSPAADDVCIVSGYAPELVGGRTFTDFKLRNLVLYNLAPRGSGLPLEGGDAAWANSSLPLWYFGLTRC
ncbi:hypothetical protein GPECTOR_41g618 [Gonium pectorale]|uniref:Uncharacterized protein n=1 Tax=Gonium pectorale TaxID=33097 RepID=A0A150G9Y4_GONPE|nr:hypothetical protein GPECTOR_41g618 [Gonium pectorale]|eukprot:KXZ46654.1 hypothetical protein GPECTOR_41g618 [Gonium pectorale]